MKQHKFKNYRKVLASEFLPLPPSELKRTQKREKELAIKPGEAHIVQEEREIILITQEPEEKPARKPGKAHSGKEEVTLIKKLCKNCN